MLLPFSIYSLFVIVLFWIVCFDVLNQIEYIGVIQTFFAQFPDKIHYFFTCRNFSYFQSSCEILIALLII